MKPLAVDDRLIESAGTGYRFPGIRSVGECRSAKFAPAEFALQMVRATLAVGAELRWSPHAGDEVVYILRGSVEVGGRSCPADSALLIRAESDLSLRAESATVLLHFGHHGPDDSARTSRTRERVTIVGPRGTYATVDEERDTHFYAESDDDFPATFFYTGRTGPYRSRPHSHSQDEIIYVASGSIALGSRVVPAGSAIGVPADRSYGFVGDSAGFALLNYRRGPSYFSGSDGAQPFLEGGHATGMAKVVDPAH